MREKWLPNEQVAQTLEGLGLSKEKLNELVERIQKSRYGVAQAKHYERKPIAAKVRYEIFRRDNFTCQYCGAKAPNVELELDHIMPVSRGGFNDPDNLITACRMCNRGKGDSYPAAGNADYFIEKKTQRVQLVMQPSLYKRAQRAAEKQDISFNEMLHRLLNAYLNEIEKEC